MKKTKKIPFFKRWGKRSISLKGRINYRMADKVERRMRIFLKENSILPVRIVLNSTGGEITAAIRIGLKLKHATCPIEVHCLAATGVATIIVASGTPGRRIGYSFSRILPKISFKEIKEDPNLVPFLNELLASGWFQTYSLCYPFELSADISILAETKREREIVWNIISQHFSTQKIVLLKDLSYEERNHLLIQKLFSGLLSMFTGIQEKICYEFIHGIWEGPSRFEKAGSRKRPLSLPPEDALSIGLIDQIQIRRNGFD